jgi:hypothetical protein
MFCSMNNERLNLATIEELGKPQLKHVPYGAFTIAVALEEPLAAAAPMGTKCLAARSMPMNATCFVRQTKYFILQKLIIHDHTYLPRGLLLSQCHVSLLFSLPVVFLHLQVVLFVLP